MGAGPPPDLVLGPILRWADDGAATVWAEASAPCEVEVLGRRERTFAVAGRHYAIVALEGLDPGAEHPYRVSLDGVVCWPPPGSALPASAIRMPPAGARRARIAVGSCRVAAPETPRAAGSPDDDPPARGPDALRALARRAIAAPAERPDLLLMIGDQVYVDLGPGRRGPVGFEDLARLYVRAWSDPAVRWLLSAVPGAMILDDHEVAEGWNTSARWWRERARDPAWRGRLTACLAAYWVYQHLGNLAPAQLRRDPLLRAVRAADDGMDALAPWAAAAGRARPSFAFARRVGPARVVVADARGRRILDPGRRDVLDEDGWAWLDGALRADAPHVVLVTSVPAFLPAGLHDLEAWSEAVAGGAWGRWATGLGEAVRRAYSLEHWPAFGGALARLTAMLGELARGERGGVPASVVIVAGEVHHGSLTRVLPPGADGGAPVWQLVSSPLRNLLGRRNRALLRIGSSRPFAWAARAAARAAGVRRAAARWEAASPPVFANHVALLDLDGPAAALRVEAAVAGADGIAALHTVLAHPLGGGACASGRARLPSAHPTEGAGSVSYLKPGAFTRRVFNPIAMRLGLGGSVTLAVPGRRTGRMMRVPVLPVEHEGARYLVSTRGESDWVRNLRAAGRAELHTRRGAEPIRATELPVGEREPVIAAYRPAAGRVVERYWRRLPDPADHPVFRIEPG